MKRYEQTRRRFLKSLCLGAAAIATQNVPTFAARKDRPNVILIMTDDQGYGDFGATGNPIIMTPNIDAMAKRSGSMANFYVHPVCAPTRACLMTGRYNYRTRAIDTFIGRAMMDSEETTVAEILRDAGYATGIFGKWHLGDSYPMRPMDQGFTESLVHRGGGIGQPSDPPGGEGKYTDPILLDNGKLKPFKGYCTDVYFDRAMSWISKCAAKGDNFFAYIPTNAPHGPFHDVPDDLYQRYKKMNLGNKAFPQDKGHPLPTKNNQDVRARIFAMITNVDENIGRLFRKLDNLGITENTIVIFLVDNGPNERRYVAGMKGNKSCVHEGGIRSPFFFQWPGVVKPGSSSDIIAAHIDVLPTLLDACRIRKPTGLKLDGRSLLPLLKGQSIEWTDRTIFIQSHRGDKPLLYHNFAARSQRWKLLHASGFGKENFDGKPKFELYDMVADPLEQNDLAAERPDMVEKMRKEYEAWFADVSSTRPDNYAPPRIYIGTRHENPVVLTRQDWRHIKDQPWAKNSNGYWELYAAEPNKYNVRLRFPKTSADGTATLEFAGITKEKNIPSG
ncbi:MAG: arylsulfatase, partial [Sedimentisphaerales bacterium]|nr:arylsulfatase [Sedimentisphaerales bacterium]